MPFYDNDKIEFPVGHSSGEDNGCEWLRNNPDETAEFCEVGKGAYLNCKETYASYYDNDYVSFPVDHSSSEDKGCKWLRNNLDEIAKLCH